MEVEQKPAEDVCATCKYGRDWPAVLNMLIKGGGEDNSDQPEIGDTSPRV